MSRDKFYTFWHGDELSPLEYVCLRSFVDKGHSLTVFVYENKEMPNGVKIEDAREVLPKEDLFFFESSPSAFSNIFRYKILLMRGGWWVDTDVYCLNEAIPNTDYCWAEQEPGTINGAILKFPKSDPLCKRLLDESIKRAKTLSVWGELGPNLLTEVLSGVSTSSLFNIPSAFYPIHWLETHLFWLPDCMDNIAQKINNGMFLHMWHSMFGRMGIDLKKPPPDGSFLKSIFDKEIQQPQLRQPDYDITLSSICDYFYNNAWAKDYWVTNLNRDIRDLWPQSMLCKMVENYSLSKNTEIVAKYETHVSELHTRINSLEEDRYGLERYSKQLSESIAGYEKQVSELNTKIDTHVKDRNALEQYTEQLFENIAGYEKQVSELNMRVDSLWENIIDKDRRIDDLLNSFSWRITGPIRMLADLFYNLESIIKKSYQPKLRLLSNIFSLFMNHPKKFIKNMNYSTISAFIKQFNRLDPLALEYEVRRKLSVEYEKPIDYFALFTEQVDEKKILVVDRFVPAYDTNSGALRMFTILNILNDLEYKVTFIPDNLSPKEPYVTELRSVGIEVVCGDVNVEEYFVKYGPQFRYVILSEAFPAFNFISYVRAYAVNATVLYDTVDIHWVRLERSAAISGSVDVRNEAELFKKMELFNIKSSDVVLTVTNDEKEYLESMDPSWKVAVIPNIHEVVTTGITSFEKRKDIMFIGHFLHDPNVDAVKYFIKDIFPLIKKEIPDIKFYIVGSNPVQEVMELKSDNIEVTGYVKDVSPYFESCRVFVSPLRFGAGMKGKIGQSMTYGLPVVTTSIGAEGIGLTDEENVLIADDPTKFAQSVIKVYRDKYLWEKLSTSSMQYIDSHYSKRVVSEIIAELFESLDK